MKSAVDGNMNHPELGSGAVVLRGPTHAQFVAAIAGFTNLFGCVPDVSVQGVWGRWDLRIGNPRRVLFVGTDYIEVDMAEQSAARRRDQHPVRLTLADGKGVIVRLKIPK